MDIIIDEITKAESTEAKNVIQTLDTLTRNQAIKTNRIVSLNIDGNEEKIPIPQKAYHILEQALKNISKGTSFRLISEEEMIGTQEAADLLKISRPYLVKLLESGEIPFSKAGTHRRVSKKEIMDYDKKRKKTRLKHLNFLAKQAQELNLGYE